MAGFAALLPLQGSVAPNEPLRIGAQQPISATKQRESSTPMMATLVAAKHPTSTLDSGNAGLARRVNLECTAKDGR
jgi:hypothetical protein